MNFTTARASQPAQPCYIAMRVMDEDNEPVLYGVFLDMQQALAAARSAEASEESDLIRNLASYGFVQSVLIYPLGVEQE